MALNKKITSSLLVATIVAGGLYIGIDNRTLAKENESLKNTIQETSIELKKQEESNTELNNKLKESEKELESTKEDLENTKSDLDKTKTDLNNTKTKLKETEKKLEAKNNSVSVASTSNSLARTSGSVSSSSGQPVKITMTFYGSNIDGMSDITASGKKCAAGMVASNYYPIGTKFEYNGQIYTVMDRGGSGLNGPNNLDVYVPRNAGESDSQYRARLLQYGRKTVTMNKL